MAPTEMRALALRNRPLLMRILRLASGYGFSCGATVQQIATPSITDSEVLVRVTAAALNPVDVLHIDIVGPPRSIVGCDYCGIVEKVGPTAIGGFRIGDRIAGMVHGGLFPDKGAFAEYLKVEPDLAWKPPAHLSDEQAATYGVSALTAMQGLYTKLDIPWPGTDASTSGESSTILVYAGSTSASLFAIQLAKLAKLTVVATCSPRNFDLVKQYGADAVYDYRSSSSLTDIKTAYSDINRAFDGISLKESTAFCVDVVEKNGGKVVVLLDTRKAGKGRDVDITWTMVFTLLGQPFQLFWPAGPKFPVIAPDRKALVDFYEMLPNIIQDVKPPPTQKVEGGFDGLLEGLEMLRTKQVSGQKLVVSFDR